MKSKPFARKLKNPKVGFRYFRIWGTPLQPHNVACHQDRLDGATVVFEHPVHGWMTLYVLESVVLPRPYSGLNGSVDDRYFNKKAAAIKVLEDYKALRTSKGLSDMCYFHQAMDAFDDFFYDIGSTDWFDE